MTDLFSQSALQLIEMNDGIAGIQQVQLAVEGIFQHTPLRHKHQPHCIQELRTPIGSAGRLRYTDKT